MLTVERILTLNNTNMSSQPQRFTGSLQCRCNTKVWYCRKFNGSILQGGVFKPHRAGSYDHIARQHIHSNSAASTDADKSIRTDVMQLFHRDGSRRTANTRRTNGHLLAQQCTGINIILPVHTNMNGVIKTRGNGLTSPWITGQKYLTAYITLDTVNMELSSGILHFGPPILFRTNLPDWCPAYPRRHPHPSAFGCGSWIPWDKPPTLLQ